MNKVKTLDDLRKMRETLRSTLDIREKVIILNNGTDLDIYGNLRDRCRSQRDHELFH